MTRRIVLICATIASCALLFLACGQSTETSETQAEETESPATAAPATAVPATAVPEPTAVPATAVPATAVPEPTAVPATAVPEPTAVPAASACPVDAAPGQTSATLDSSGNTYEYTFQVPTSYDGTPLALVLNFHGLGSRGSEQAPFSGYPALAESEGFVVAHPTGQPDPGGRNSWELSWADDPARDDVQFVRDMIDGVAAAVCVDPARVYATGMSNGGFFSAEMVCQLGDRIAAAASVAGVTHSPSCEPIRPMPYIAFHGTADETVPYDGGGESSLGSSEFFDQVMPDEFAEFAVDFACEPEPVAVELSDTVTRFDYLNCDADAELSFYELVGHGHNWPGSFVGKAIEASLGPNNMDVDATALSWELFQRHQLPAEFQ